MKPEEIERVKDLLPTTLGSEEIRGTIAAEIAANYAIDKARFGLP